MVYDPTRHHRRSIRLKGYDYTAAGVYFVTLVVQDRAPVLGEVVDGAVRLSAWGCVVREGWEALPGRFARLRLDAYVIMPDHLHGLLVLVGDAPAPHHRSKGEASARAGLDMTASGPADASPLRARPRGTTPGSVGVILQNYKSVTARRVNALRGTPGARLWLRNYWERIVRDDRALAAVRAYIRDNPRRWSLDREARDEWGREVGA